MNRSCNTEQVLQMMLLLSVHGCLSHMCTCSVHTQARNGITLPLQKKNKTSMVTYVTAPQWENAALQVNSKQFVVEVNVQSKVSKIKGKGKKNVEI